MSKQPTQSRRLQKKKAGHAPDRQNDVTRAAGPEMLADEGDAPDIFEQEVRRVARELFSGSGGLHGVMLDQRERDAVIDSGETIHIIEATCNNTKKKAEYDLKKSVDLKKLLQRTFPDHTFKIWFITKKDPTADQANTAAEFRKKAHCPIIACSLSAFMQRMVDAPAYLEARRHYNFGSIRHPDPATPQKPVTESQFVPIDLVDPERGTQIDPDALAAELIHSPGIRLLLGDFGAGKSMTLRHIFYKMRAAHLRGDTPRFPIYVNLRDHIGQDVPSSALYDHGTRIGYTNPERLVRAWRAGFVDLLLDGFDEVASSRFRTDAEGLRNVRKRAMTLVRAFIQEHPVHSASLFLTGRENYFSSPAERTSSLGISNISHITYTLNEFTLPQVQDYLRRMGLDGESVPDWLPSRPLLVGYLAVRHILRDEGSNLRTMTRAEGWDYLLDQICHREGGQINDLGGEPDAVRVYFDRLATKARSTTSGRGPVAAGDMIDIFRQIMPSTPDEAAQQLLLRMAGLTGSTGSAVVATPTDQEDSREFVDGDMVDAARAGDVVRFITHNYNDALNSLFSDPDCHTHMGELGIEVAAFRLKGKPAGLFNSSLRYAAEILNAPALSFDILRIMQTLSTEPSDPDRKGNPIFISDGYFNDIEITPDVDLSSIHFKECFFNNVYIDQSSGKINTPAFVSCEIENIVGAANEEDLPDGMLRENTGVKNYSVFSTDEYHETTDQMPPAVRTLLASLRKLFAQSGKGRKESAFPRGLDDIERAYVKDVLDLLSKYEFAYPYKSGGAVWIPNRAKTQEALAILRAPHQSTSDILTEVKGL